MEHLLGVALRGAAEGAGTVLTLAVLWLAIGRTRREAVRRFVQRWPD